LRNKENRKRKIHIGIGLYSLPNFPGDISVNRIHLKEPANEPLIHTMAMREEGFIGCCGAYCKTCPPFIDATCKGCKLGYGPEERDIDRSRCKIKACCFRDKKLETCADCRQYNCCAIIRAFYDKNGFKYNKYMQSADYIRANGYAQFLKAAGKWKCAYGRLPVKEK
jgi:hypothetical protein